MVLSTAHIRLTRSVSQSFAVVVRSVAIISAYDCATITITSWDRHNNASSHCIRQYVVFTRNTCLAAVVLYGSLICAIFDLYGKRHGRAVDCLVHWSTNARTCTYRFFGCRVIVSRQSKPRNRHMQFCRREVPHFFVVHVHCRNVV